MLTREMATCEQEVLLTNGLGGYSLNGLGGLSFRKYHGLYTVSLKPPTERYHVISKFLMTLATDEGTFVLNPDTQDPTSEVNAYFKQVDQPGCLVETYAVDGVIITVTSAFKHLSHQMGLSYTIESNQKAQLRITPVYHIRDHHDVQAIVPEDYTVSASGSRVTVTHPVLAVTVNASVDFVSGPVSYHQSYYATETHRGYPDRENHISFGAYSVDINPGQNQVNFVIDLGQNSHPAHLALTIIEEEANRIQDLENKANWQNPTFKSLVMAADQFLVKRSTTQKWSVIAGYPWFTDWGRDTMIALPGLTLALNRFDEALEMIETFIAHQKQGIIPNNFPDFDEAPMYNTVDASLWLYQAFYAYYQATHNAEALNRLYPVLVDMLTHMIKGTINDIYQDEDGLLCSGNPTTQLTWMDVKVNGWVVTPRHGKAIEINALFYNALCIMDELSNELEVSSPFEGQADRVKGAFNTLFWNTQDNLPYDVVMDGKAYDMIRPNMLLAISLPHAVLDKKHWQRVVDLAKDHLVFGAGLRSLSPDDAEYHGLYKGNLLSRDGAYHRGTGWGWLMGPYLEAHYKTFGDKVYINQRLDLVANHLNEAGLGTYSENFDGDAPHAPRGCAAQAWSVAEAIRIIKMMQA